MQPTVLRGVEIETDVIARHSQPQRGRTPNSHVFVLRLQLDLQSGCLPLGQCDVSTSRSKRSNGQKVLRMVKTLSKAGLEHTPIPLGSHATRGSWDSNEVDFTEYPLSRFCDPRLAAVGLRHTHHAPRSTLCLPRRPCTHGRCRPPEFSPPSACQTAIPTDRSDPLTTEWGVIFPHSPLDSLFPFNELLN